MSAKLKAADFPVPRHAIRRGRIDRRGLTVAQAIARLDDMPAEYVSKGGHVRRWRSLPSVSWGIVGTNAESLDVVAVASTDPSVRFRGTRDECFKILTTAVRQWWQLPRGREIESVAAARLSGDSETPGLES